MDILLITILALSYIIIFLLGVAVTLATYEW